MKFENLNIYYRNYDKDKPFSGSLAIKGDTGTVELVLTDAEIKVIMGVCADSLVRISQEAANRMKEAINTAFRGEKP